MKKTFINAYMICSLSLGVSLAMEGSEESLDHLNEMFGGELTFMSGKTAFDMIEVSQILSEYKKTDNFETLKKLEAYSSDGVFRKFKRMCDTGFLEGLDYIYLPAIIGKLYFEDKDYYKAREYLLMASEKEVNVSYYLGLIYFNGLGCDVDYREAFINFDRVVAVTQNPDALLCLATCYEKGLGVKLDLEKALEYRLEAGCRKRHIPTIIECAEIYRDTDGFDDHLKKAFAAFKEAANLGDPKACYEVAYMQYQGIGTPANKLNAILYFIKAASGGEPRANQMLTGLYSDENNPEFLLLGADQLKHPCAQFLLGEKYHKGIGQKKDIKTAIKYYEEALKQGNLDALWALTSIYSDGQITPTKKFLRMDGSNPDHLYSLGCFYERSSFKNKKNLRLAYLLFMNALKKDHEKSALKVTKYKAFVDTNRANGNFILDQVNPKYIDAYKCLLVAEHLGDDEAFKALDLLRRNRNSSNTAEGMLVRKKQKVLKEAEKSYLSLLDYFNQQIEPSVSQDKDVTNSKRRKRPRKKKNDGISPEVVQSIALDSKPLQQETLFSNSPQKEDEKITIPQLSLDPVVQEDMNNTSEAKKEEGLRTATTTLLPISISPIETPTEMSTIVDNEPKEKKKYKRTINPIGKLFSRHSKEASEKEEEKRGENESTVEERGRSKTNLRRNTVDVTDVSQSEQSEKGKKKKKDPTEASVERSTKRSLRDRSLRRTLDADDVSRSERSEKDRRKRKDPTEASVEASTKSSRHHHKKDRFEDSWSERSEGVSRSERSTHSRVEPKTVKLSNYPSLTPLIDILNGTSAKNLRDLKLDKGVIEKTLEELKRLDRVSNHLKGNTIYSVGNHLRIRATFHKHDEPGQLWFQDPNKVKSFLIYVWEAIGCEGDPTIELLHQKLVEFQAIHLGTGALDAGEGQ